MGGTYLHNFDRGPEGDHSRDETDGYVLYGTIGELSKGGDWLLGYYYADIQKYAIARFFAPSAARATAGPPVTTSIRMPR